MWQRRPGHPAYHQASPESVVKAILDRGDTDLSATEQIRHAQDWTSGTSHLLTLWTAAVRQSLYPRIDEQIKACLTGPEARPYEREHARPVLQQKLRAAWTPCRPARTRPCTAWPPTALSGTPAAQWARPAVNAKPAPKPNRRPNARPKPRTGSRSSHRTGLHRRDPNRVSPEGRVRGRIAVGIGEGDQRRGPGRVASLVACRFGSWKAYRKAPTGSAACSLKSRTDVGLVP